MLSFLKNHPFAIEAFFDYSLTLTFAVRKEQLEGLIPPCVSLDTFNDKWAFVAVAMVQTKGLRPRGFPAFMGNDFFLAGYRVFVRYINNEGRRLRGLYILKSETDSRKMELTGNLFTHYHFNTIDIQLTTANGFSEISSVKSGFHVRYALDGNEAKLPTGSPFTDWKDARKFSGPLPFTFSRNNAADKVLIVEGLRERWIPEPVHVHSCHFDFLKQLNIGEPLLANAFIIHNIPYHWKKGIQEPWVK